MSWLSRVRNAIPFVPKAQTAENLWHKCKGCGQMIFTKELEENLYVCPKCDFHERIGPHLRFDYTFDEGSYSALPSPRVADDPLKFRDTKRYTDRIKAARTATNEPEGETDQAAGQGAKQILDWFEDHAALPISCGAAIHSRPFSMPCQ